MMNRREERAILEFLDTIKTRLIELLCGTLSVAKLLFKLEYVRPQSSRGKVIIMQTTTEL